MIQVQFETITHCNARCIFCRYPNLERPKGIMSFDLFKSIVAQAKDIPKISEMSFQGLGEPLLDQHIVDRIGFAKKTKPAWHMTMFTNGSLLTLKKAKELDKAGLNVLNVSINGNNTEQRQRVMKLGDYDSVRDVCDDIIAAHLDMSLVVKSLISMDYFCGNQATIFEKRWGQYYFLHLEGNWAGRCWNARIPQVNLCTRLLAQIMVLWDGRVALCCFDGEGDVIFGDLNTQTLKEVYSSPTYQHYREMMAKGRRVELSPCDNCTSV